MSRRWLLPIATVCIISGFFLAFVLKVQANSNTTNPLSQKNTNLVMIINDLEAEIKSQEDTLEQIRNDLSILQNESSGGRTVQELQEQLKAARIAAGLTPVVGNGLIITIDDNKDGLKANPQDDPNKYIVHFDYLLNLVSDLKIGGAEAISINGQRLITTSEIRCVGNLILVNMTRIAPPYEISVIGSPLLLTEIVNNGELDILKSLNFPISLEESSAVIIPAYKGDLQFNHPRAVKED